LKVVWSRKLANRRKLSSLEAAVCGSFSGALAAGLTTPLDVIKTRLMLGKDIHGREYRGMMDTIQRISQEGAELSPQQPLKGKCKVFFSGVQPRVMWIGIGGFIFFGAYEQSVRICRMISL
jgi:solute carrier family 25 S-adenosylmethionine transporter 26